MPTVADFAEEFVRQARDGEPATVRVRKEYAEAFLGALAREGFQFAKDCLKQITDPALRRIVEAIYFTTVAGAAAGAAIGAIVAGPSGAKVGAIVGAGAGLVAGCGAVTLTAKQVDGPRGPELVLAVAQ